MSPYGAAFTRGMIFEGGLGANYTARQLCKQMKTCQEVLDNLRRQLVRRGYSLG